MTTGQHEHQPDWATPCTSTCTGRGCGHEVCRPARHHVDYIHDGHRHAAREDHYDEHSEHGER